MREWVRWLLIVLAVVIAAIGCFGGKRTTGTNTNVGTGSDNHGPWSGGTIAAQPTGP